MAVLIKCDKCSNNFVLSATWQIRFKKARQEIEFDLCCLCKDKLLKDIDYRITRGLMIEDMG